MSKPRSHAPSSHARLHKAHKRGNSSSSLTRPLSPVADQGPSSFTTLTMPANSPPPPANPFKIKPIFKKLSYKDTTALDLSRPSHENESLAGLGISEFGDDHHRHATSVSDVTFAPAHARQRHHHHHSRNASNTSQFSTTSSNLQRPTASYIRQTPTSYPPPPPASKSPPPSIMGSEQAVEDMIMEEEWRLRKSNHDPNRRSASLSSLAGAPLRINTTNSTTPLGGSYSPSTLSLASPMGTSRPRADTLRSVDTATSPSTRTSLDKFRFMHSGGGRDSPVVDPASRAASIRAARQAFNEKEEAKERRQDREAHKQAERDTRKQHKKEERLRRKSETTVERADFNRTRSTSDTKTNNTNATSTPRPSLAGPRPSIGGRQYSDHREVHTHSLPRYTQPSNFEKSEFAAPKVTKSRAAKGRWQRFVAWLQTRLLRLSKKFHV